jgi:hypothetical protein
VSVYSEDYLKVILSIYRIFLAPLWVILTALQAQTTHLNYRMNVNRAGIRQMNLGTLAKL